MTNENKLDQNSGYKIFFNGLSNSQIDLMKQKEAYSEISESINNLDPTKPTKINILK